MSSDITDAEFVEMRGETSHPAGCTFVQDGPCGWWSVADGCDQSHFERHVPSHDGRCPCGLDLQEDSPVIGQADDF